MRTCDELELVLTHNAACIHQASYRGCMLYQRCPLLWHRACITHQQWSLQVHAQIDGWPGHVTLPSLSRSPRPLASGMVLDAWGGHAGFLATGEPFLRSGGPKWLP
jgi:hypothetical protein